MKNTLIITALLCFCLKGYAQANLDETYVSFLNLRERVVELQREGLSISQSIRDSGNLEAMDDADWTREIIGDMLVHLDLARIVYFLLDKDNSIAIDFSMRELERMIQAADSTTQEINLARGHNSNVALESINRDARNLNFDIKNFINDLLAEL